MIGLAAPGVPDQLSAVGFTFCNPPRLSICTIATARCTTLSASTAYGIRAAGPAWREECALMIERIKLIRVSRAGAPFGRSGNATVQSCPVGSVLPQRAETLGQRRLWIRRTTIGVRADSTALIADETALS